MLKKYNVIFLGQSNLATLLLTGSCTSWNGKVCTSNDTVEDENINDVTIESYNKSKVRDKEIKYLEKIC